MAPLIKAQADNTDDINDADTDTANEIQDLSRVGNTLSLTSDASTVDLAPYLDNTDALAGLSCTTNQIAQFNGANWVCATASSGDSAIMETSEPFMGANTDTYASSNSSGTEIRNRYKAPRSGTIKNLCIIGNIVPAAGSSITVKIRVNGGDSALSVGPYTNANANGLCNTVGTLSINQGDLISVRFQETNGTNSGSNVRATYEYQLN